MTQATRLGWLGVVILAAYVAGLEGCRPADEAPRVRVLEVTVEKIDYDTREVTVSFVDKRGETRELSAVVDPDTEILINGKVASLRDVQVKDRARVAGYRTENASGLPDFEVLRVEIERPADWQLTAERRPRQREDRSDAPPLEPGTESPPGTSP